MPSDDVKPRHSREIPMTPARRRLRALAVVVLIALLAWTIYEIVKPAFQNTIVITTGADNGIYRGYADKYAQILKREGVKLDIRPSSGSVQNYERLADAKSVYDVGFVQSGTTNPKATDDLETIAVVSYEPIWVFYRGDAEVNRLAQLRGKRIAVGVQGSGLLNVSLVLLGYSDITRDNTTLLEMDAAQAYQGLQDGRLDAGFFIGRPDAQIQQQLLNSHLKLMSFAQADALVQKFPSLSKVVFPRASTSIVSDLPQADVTLLAAKALLVAKGSLHPAMIYLLLEAAKEVHGGEDYFTSIGEFPNLRTNEFPMSDESDLYFKSGKPFLQHYLPFWLANFIERRLLVLLPFMAVLLALLRALPSLVESRIKRRLIDWYRDLKALEDELWTVEAPTPDQVTRWREEVDYIDAHVSRLRMPRRYIKDVYSLKQAIGVVRGRIGDLAQRAERGASRQ